MGGAFIDKKNTHALGRRGPLGRELGRGTLVTGLEVELGALGADRRVLGGRRGGHCFFFSFFVERGGKEGKGVRKGKRRE